MHSMINWFWRACFITRWGLCGLTAFAPMLNWFLKDPNTLSGFTQNKIISEILYLAWFEDKQLQGPLLSEYFDLISLKTLALIFTMVCTFLYHHILFLLFQQIDFCLHEWLTGAFLQAKFFEKDVIHTHKIYQAKVEAWSNLNLTVTSNIQKKLFTHALYVHHSIPWALYTPPPIPTGLLLDSQNPTRLD